MSKGFKHGGSSFGSKGTLTIFAPSGSTITISKDGKTYSKAVNEDGVAFFKGLDGGTWNIRATDGTSTRDVTMQLVVDYSAEIKYLYFVFNGESDADYVGGWSTEPSDGVLSVVTGGTGQIWIAGKKICSNEAIDISRYSTMHIVVSSYNYGGTFGIGTTNANGSYDKSVSITSAKEYNIDVSDINGEYYVKLGGNGKQNNNDGVYESTGFKVSKVWLE